MSDLLAHLIAPLDQDGHFLNPDGMLALYTDYDHVHDVEHEPGWWSEALLHTHDGPLTVPRYY